MVRTVPAFARLVFYVHVIVAAVTGATMLFAPDMMGSTFGYPESPAGLVPVLRSYGALLLVFGGLTSLLCARARSWERVEIVVLSEIAYLCAATLLYVTFLITGSGPVAGNVVFLLISTALLVLFGLVWVRRPV